MGWSRSPSIASSGHGSSLFDGRKPAIVRVRSDRAVLLEDVVDAADW